MDKSFYEYQHDRFGILLNWGILNTIAGLIVSRSKREEVKHVGLQAAAWGIINAAIASFGRRGARAAQTRLESGEIGTPEQEKAAHSFKRILLINAFLDVGYVTGGSILASKAKRADRKGMGVGIIVQGLFLLVYDGLLAYEVGSKWLDDRNRSDAK